MFSEDHIRNLLFKRFSGSSDLVVAKWRGWTIYGTGGIGESVLLRREFDIAKFERTSRPYISPTITLTGYEVKGVTATGKAKGRFPSFAEGLDQTIVHLYEGADYSYLVWPEPDDKTKQDLKSLLDNHSPAIGLIFVRVDDSLWEYRHPPTKNPRTSDEIKKRMLTSLLSGGQYSESHVPEWAKKHDF
jgi:hypothetical protein